MDEKSLKTLLESTRMPVAYHHYTSPPQPPYLIYLFSDAENFGADNKVYISYNAYDIELYTLEKDPAAEKKLETVLNAAEIYWEKSEVRIETEGLYRALYEI